MTTATIQLPPDMPAHMKQLKRDSVGRPIPWFVPYIEGEPDFRFTDMEKIVTAITGQRCFVCGDRLNRVRHSSNPKGTFVAGPMCLINRTSAEPPNHSDCAEWSSKACPFLTKPRKIRRTSDMPEDAIEPAGVMIERNPGVTALIESERWSYFTVPDGMGGKGILFTFDRITNVRWMSEGWAASTEQVLTSIETGLPALVEMAESETGGMRALSIKARSALRWMPGKFDVSDYPVIESLLGHLP